VLLAERTDSSAVRGSQDAVEAELRAQIHIAIAAGFDLTHLDSHTRTGSAYGEIFQ